MVISEHIGVFRYKVGISFEFQICASSQQFRSPRAHKGNVLVLIFCRCLQLALHFQVSRYTHKFRSTNIEPLDKFLAFLCHGVQVTLHFQGRRSTRKLGTMLPLIRHVRRIRFRISIEIPAAF